ncbi:hypothetical protein [Micromonospora sp. NBC_01796]|uniref:hypothetical protein n=1 Tax=Micromonospora sp. NBC_01796 TaxID=2975987 RepID=UPI002DDB1E18|nr:hypothetical protein [Micromonospora sp. NBC_01796]WSA87465.1 hypothetical protein OIE47_07595 [Micromonospora sp. NBC_01796]
MSDTPFGFSRRGLLVTAATASAVTVAGATPALGAPPEAPVAGTGATAVTVTRDRIATAVIRSPGGGLAAWPFQVDLHDRLGGWLAFWSANSPSSWQEPVEVAGRTESSGATFTLTGLRHRRDDQVRDGFAAGRTDRAYWATLASLHHHFALVEPTGDGVRVTGGAAGFTGSPDQVAFAASACRELWGYRAASTADWRSAANRALRRAGQPADIASRAGWATFTRTSLRLGLDTESY